MFLSGKIVSRVDELAKFDKMKLSICTYDVQENNSFLS